MTLVIQIILIVYILIALFSYVYDQSSIFFVKIPFIIEIDWIGISVRANYAFNCFSKDFF